MYSIVNRLNRQLIQSSWGGQLSRILNRVISLFHRNLCELLFFKKFFFLKKNNKNDLIVSLASFPERITTVHLAIKSILNQSLIPSKVILNLEKSDFPNKEKDLPKNLLNLKKFGLEFFWCGESDAVKSFTKLLPTLVRFPNQPIVTVDDDIIYRRRMLKCLYDNYLNHITNNSEPMIFFHSGVYFLLEKGRIIEQPSYIKDHLLKKSLYSNFLNGVGACLYSPQSLHSDCHKKEVYTQLCPHHDDLWFWAMAVLNKTKLRSTGKHFPLIDIAPTRMYDDSSSALTKTNSESGQGQAEIQTNDLLEHYPKILSILQEEQKVKC